ncbi:beta-phosphoglucomutase [Loigolactobacillus jiayinensis]|uniref:Beta-phosphoglucomutase n=1 Tax=Loigolactobacillus jiayinensis TaxID=2486016 RepID=A0ABW1RC24_9LACO|nr:beta-phosphoglucomutase [Loigolactobacillus jiayinensis]
MFKGALFDLDGVIADTAILHFKAWQQLMRTHFKIELPLELETKTKGVSRNDSLQTILNFCEIKVSSTQFIQLAAEKNTIYQSFLTELTSTNILPGITRLINDLRVNHIPLALASASQNGPLILDKLGLRHNFAAIEDPSQVKHGKPAPDIFIAAANSLGLDPIDCVGFEDSIAGITAINTSGATAIAIGNATELKAATIVVNNTDKLSFNTITTAFIEAHKE